MPSPSADLHPRSPSQLVDAAFTLFKRTPLPYIQLAALTYAPLLAINIAFRPSTTTALGRAQLTSLVIIGIASLLIGQLTTAAIAIHGAKAWFGRDADVAETLREFAPRIPALLTLGALKIIPYAVGFALFFIGGVYAIAAWFASPVIVALEGRNPFAALARSSELSSTRKLHILGALLLVFALQLILSLGVSTVIGVAKMPILTAIVGGGVSILFLPVVALTNLMLYYDARIRGEAFDLEVMVDALDGAPAPAPSPAP